MKTQDWMKDATASAEDEVARMNPELPASVREGIVLDTASSDEEFYALARRLRQLEPGRASTALPWLRPLVVGGGLLVAGAAAAAGAVFVAPSLLAEPAVQEPATLALAGDASHALTDSITVSGLGEVRLDRVHARGAELSLVHGVARFDVDPQGPARALRVTAGDVEVSVLGTVFSVHRLGEDVEVQVERGEVGVRWNGESVTVLTGESWRRGSGIVAAAPTDVVTPEPEAAQDGVAGDGLVDEGTVDPGPDPTVPSEPTPDVRPTLRDQPRATTGGTPEPAPEPGAAVASEPDPCAVDSFSPECARSRLRNRTTSPETRYNAMKAARARVAYSYDVADTLVSDANQFLDQWPDSPYADEVRAFRVEGAFYVRRASQTISFADAFLASAPQGHPSIPQVEQWRRIATLRRDAVDTAQRDCVEADPHLAELVRLETGLRKDEARAHRGLCAYQLGDADKAQALFRTIENEARLPVALRRQVRAAWEAMLPEPVERSGRK